MKKAMTPADRQSTLSKPLRPQKHPNTDRTPGRGATTRRKAEYASEEDQSSWNFTAISQRGTWEPQAQIDHVMEKCFTPVHTLRHDEMKVRKNHHYLSHYSHHHQQHQHHHHHHDHHQDKESHGYATPGASNGHMSQGHINHQHHGHHTPDLDHPHNRPHHHHSQHYCPHPDMSLNPNSQNLDPVASSSGSYSFTSSSSSWSSEASVDTETFFTDRSRPGPRHSQSCSNIPGDGQGLWDEEEEEEEEANLLEFEKRHLRHQHHQRPCMHKLYCSHSKSEEGLLHANSNENVRPLHLKHSPLYKSASLGRSLAFSDDTEILLDSGEPKKTVSSNPLSSKGILKKKQGQGGAVGVASDIRKAKSLEVLSTRVEKTAEGPKAGRGWVGKPKPEDENVEKRKEAVRQNFVREKLRFSAFLNEITRRVMSPSRLSSLGVTCVSQSTGQVDSPKYPRKEQRAEGKSHEGGQKHRQQKDRSGTPDSVASSVHSSKYPDSSKQHHHHRHSIGGSSQQPQQQQLQQQQHTPGSRTNASMVSPQNCPLSGQGQDHRGEKQHQGGHNTPLTDNINTSPQLSPHLLRHHHSQTHHHPDPFSQHQKHHQPHPEKHQHHRAHRSQSPHSSCPCKSRHTDTHSGVLGQQSYPENKDTTLATRPSSEHSGRDKQACYRASAVQHKDLVADVERVHILRLATRAESGQYYSSRVRVLLQSLCEQQQSKCRPSMQAVSAAPEQNEELRHSLLQTVVRMECMEADLQKTQVELNSVKESFQRLQENSSNAHQTNQLLEQKLQAMVPVLLPELLDEHSQSKEAVTDFLLPATQFTDQVDKVLALGDGQPHARGLEGKECGGNPHQGSEGGQHRFTAFQSWRLEQGHRMRAERDQKGSGDAGVESKDENGTSISPSIEITPIQFTPPQQSSPSNILDYPAGGRHGARGHQLSSPIHILFSSSEKSQPISTQQQCHRGQNPDKHDAAAVRCMSGPLKFLPPEGGAQQDSAEDEIVHNWRIRNSFWKAGSGRNSSENDTGAVTYRSAQRMLDNFMRHLHPPKEESKGKGDDRGWACGPKEEVPNGERE